MRQICCCRAPTRSAAAAEKIPTWRKSRPKGARPRDASSCSANLSRARQPRLTPREKQPAQQLGSSGSSLPPSQLSDRKQGSMVCCFQHVRDGSIVPVGRPRHPARRDSNAPKPDPIGLRPPTGSMCTCGLMQCDKPRCYSITSSARARNDSGIVRPSALAVMRLMVSLNLVGCSTGIDEIDGKFESGRLFNGDIAGLRPAQNFINEIGGAPEQVWEAWSKGDQTSHFRD
jgi:hypothetical protein